MSSGLCPASTCIQVFPVSGTANARIQVRAQTMADVDVALRLETLSDRTWLEKVSGLAAGVERRGVTVLEADVIVVRIEGDALEFENCTCLVGRAALLFGQGLDRRAIRTLGIVEDARGWNDTAGGNLAIDRPVALNTVVRVDGRQPRGVVASIGDEAIRIVRAETTDGLAVVRILFGRDAVVR